MTKGIQGWISLFKTGTHTSSNGVTKIYNDKDLESIEQKYNSNRDKHEAPVVIGHPEENAPAWGWLEAVKKEGAVLKGKLKQVAPEFAQAVIEGRFKKRSVKMSPKYGIEHVGFLGAALPAVEGLQDIEFKSNQDDNDIFEFDSSDETFEFSSYKGDSSMIIDAEKLKKLQEENEAMKKKIQVLEVENKTSEDQQFSKKLDDLEKENAELKQKAAKMEQESKRKGCEEFCASIPEQITPKNKDKVVDFLMAFDNAGDYEFSQGGKKSLAEEFKTFLKEQPKAVDFNEYTNKGKAAGKVEPKEYSFSAPVDPDAATLDAKVTAYSKQHNVDYEKALDIILDN
ncbi:MAG: hypothetical protein HY817_01525 [Candidatus Abawacabacteria bacterium]|nr:hypothetical protein [Candidatus Abawacabacteria bacterium]